VSENNVDISDVSTPSSEDPNQGELFSDESIGKRTVVQHTTEFMAGPIPPPYILAEYDHILQGSAERILKMAEDQSKHRQSLEKWAVKGGTILSFFGVICALIIALVTIYFGSKLILADYQISGTLFAGAGLTGLVTAFIYGTRSRRQERLEKLRASQELKNS
jgi:uncharacterized membrane protein